MSTTTKNKEPMEMHGHVMCLQLIENKSMLMHSNHMPIYDNPKETNLILVERYL